MNAGSVPPKPDLSIVAPMYNEEEGIELFFNRLIPVLKVTGKSYQVVCVNDGSDDSTLSILKKFKTTHPFLKIIDLSRNFGKDVALSAGIDFADGRAVIPIDSDLQDPPELITEMVKKWDEGYDVVTAKRASRDSDSFGKRLSAGWFYRLFNQVSPHKIPENTGDYRLMDEKVVKEVRKLKERNRFMKGLFAWVGFKQTSIEFIREERAEGQTKWNYWKLWNFALNGIFSFSSVPLRIWSYLGLVISSIAFIYAIFLIGKTLILGRDVPGYASIMVVSLFLGGIQLTSLGVIGEYLARIYDEAKERPLYVVNEVI